MTADRDVRIRMDCSSQYAVASLIQFKDRFPTAVPMVYELQEDMKPIRRYYLGDQDAVKKVAGAVEARSRAKA